MSNAPRCQVGKPQCRNQAAGYLTVGGKRFAICEDDWLEMAGLMEWPAEDPLAAFKEAETSWEPLLPGLDRAVIAP